ncbi:MAG TPA: aminoglycoside 3-N-acetyltransferase [Solirubrobacterales bacterium]|jgi:aminoglycoside 3-N-acetyltransferase
MPRRAVTRSELARELREFGVAPGGALIVHTRMSALGWVVGAAETVAWALLDALGPEGTLVAYTSWEEHAYDDADRPEGLAEAYRAGPPVFDPATSEAVRDHGRVPERIRTWPGAVRSAHPEASVAALGARAEWIAHPHADGYGPESPFARLVEAEGQVLMLGAPLDTITLLHHAEAIARARGRRELTYTVWVREGDRVAERTITDIDTRDGAYDYASLKLDVDEFEAIARDALAAGIGTRGKVGEATCHLFEARALTEFAVAWLEERFGRA